jgi:hypothetical protein
MDGTEFTHLVMFGRAVAPATMKREQPPSVIHLPIACRITPDASNFIMGVINKEYDAAPSHTESRRPGTPATMDTHRLICIHWHYHLDSGLVGWLSPLDKGLVKSSKLLLQQKVLGDDSGDLFLSVD